MSKPAVNLTPAEVVTLWNNAVTVGTLANWRSKGKGPPFIKYGTRVRYPLAGLEAYDAANLRAGNDNKPNGENDNAEPR